MCKDKNHECATGGASCLLHLSAQAHNTILTLPVCLHGEIRDAKPLSLHQVNKSQYLETHKFT